MPVQPASDGAMCEIQWYGHAPLTLMVGSATVASSEFEITGLTRGQQYRVRVRAVRATCDGITDQRI